MSVFVDALFECESTDAQAFRVGAKNGHRWCHLIADTDDELHAFAARLGMRRAWFQAPPKASHPHYDLTPGRRAKAVALGAFEVDGRTLAQIMRAHLAIRSDKAETMFGRARPRCMGTGTERCLGFDCPDCYPEG